MQTVQAKKGGIKMSQDKKTVETMVPQDYKPEAEEVIRFMDKLDQGGKGKFLEFIRGAEFALNLLNQKPAV